MRFKPGWLKTWHLGAGLFLLLVLFWAWRTPPPDSRVPVDRPWQVERLHDGYTRALALVPGASTLEEAMARYGRQLEAALFESPGRPMTLEAYYSEASVGGITGRLVLTLDPPPALVQGLRARSRGGRRLETGTVRHELDPQDADVLLSVPIRALSFFPTASLDADTVRARFGVPAERQPVAEGVEQWVYPDRGVAVTLRERGRDNIDYVRPSDLAWLREALEASRSSSE
jgi:hypothetical protein